MKHIRKLVTEIHRRSLWQVLGVYAVASWVIYQVVVALWEGIGLPSWVPGTALVLLLIGLPIVLATAFVQEGAPGLRGEDGRGTMEGLEGTADVLVTEGRTTRANATPTATPGPAALLSWNRAITGGVLAFALLGLAASGFMGMRALGIGPAATLISSGLIEEREPLVLAEFEALTGDTALATIATQAFRIDMEQSPTVRLAPEDLVTEILERMERAPETRLQEDVAREVALRGGMKAYIAGDVSRAGSAVVFSARIVAAADGKVLAAYREAARDSSRVVQALDRLSEKIRSKIGESLRSVRTAPRLTDITSPSLPAIQLFLEGTEALNRADLERGPALLREAVALDSAFAFAYRKLAAHYSNMGQLAAAYDAITRALAHPERLSRFERLHAEAMAGSITGDDDRSLRAYETLLELDSLDYIALNNLALAYVGKGNWARAAEIGLRAVERSANPRPLSYTNAARELFGAGRAAEADSVLRLLAATFPGHPVTHFGRVMWASSHGDYDEAADHARAASDALPGSLSWQRGSHRWAGTLDGIQGRLRSADAEYARAQALSERMDDDALAMVYALRRSRLASLVAGDTARARALIAEARALEPVVAFENHPYPLLAAAYAGAGLPDSARHTLDRFEATAPEWLRQRLHTDTRMARAQIALAEGRPAAARPILKELIRENGLDLGPHALQGLANEMVDRHEAAITSYQSYLETPRLYRGVDPEQDALFRAFVHERLGRLYEKTGDAAGRTHYAAFIDLWHGADPELQPRVQAARGALVRLTAEQGRR